MPKSRQLKHGSGKRPYMSKMALRTSLNAKMTQQELDTLEKVIRKLVEETVADAVNLAYQRHWAVVMRVLRDRFGWGSVRLRRLWDECLSFLDDIESGEVSAEEILQSLYDEDGIRIIWTYKTEDEKDD